MWYVEGRDVLVWICFKYKILFCSISFPSLTSTFGSSVTILCLSNLWSLLSFSYHRMSNSQSERQQMSKESSQIRQNLSVVAPERPMAYTLQVVSSKTVPVAPPSRWLIHSVTSDAKLLKNCFWLICVCVCVWKRCWFIVSPIHAFIGWLLHVPETRDWTATFV